MPRAKRRWLHRPPVDAHTARIDIDADPHTVYAIVSDVTGTGRHSPECRRVEWLPGHDHPRPGARFRGHNTWRGFSWPRDAVVTDARPAERFAFETVPAAGINNSRTAWTYELTSPRPGATVLTQTFEFYAPRRIKWMDTLMGRPRALRRNIDASLAGVKRLAERRNTSVR